MRFILVFLVCFSFAQQGFAQQPSFNAEKAAKLGADDFGMRYYVMAFLKTGKKQITDSAQIQGLLNGHLKNIFRLADEGKLVVAGPSLDSSSIRGIFVFNVKTIEEAEKLTATDPAIKAGMFDVEFHPWYASAALMEVMSIHNVIQKKRIVNR